MSNLPAKLPEINSVPLSEIIIKGDGAVVALQADYTALINEIQLAKKEGGITPELDKKMNNMQVSMKLTVEAMYNTRLPYTKEMNNYISLCTGLEALISPKQTDPKHPLHKDGMYATLQRERDAYAQHLKNLSDKAAREQEAKINKANERVTLKANCERIIRTLSEQAITAWKSKANAILESATLTTIDGVDDTITAEEWSLFTEADVLKQTIMQARFHDTDEVKAIYTEVYTLGLQSELTQKGHNDTNEYLDHIRKAIPGKRKELENIAAAGEAEAKRLKEEAEQRAAAAQQSLNLELDKKEQDIASTTEAAKQAGIADNLFNAKPVVAAPTGVRNACTIRVLSVKAYPSIIAKWHMLKGVQLTPEEYSRTKVESMVKAVEKLYLQSGEKVESPDIIYEEVVKTSARK